MDGTMRMPLARDEGLVVEELGDELLVYDLGVDRVHCLNPKAVRVWRACDGRTPVATIAADLGLDTEEVVRALDELDRCEFLAAPVEANGGLSRRDFGVRVTKIAAATASVPLIVSIAAPVAAHAQTPSACVALDFKGSCGICNQGGTPTACCCCHAPNPVGCAIDAAECCGGFIPQFEGATHCTEQGGQILKCK